MAWRAPEDRDLTAKLNQRELQAFNMYATSADPAEDLLAQTAELVRGFCRRNRTLKLCPTRGTIPESLISPAMDVAVYDVLKRLNVPVSEARKAAWEKALEIFRDVANGTYTPESWSQNASEADDAQSNLALPGFTSSKRRFILNEYL